MGDGRSSRPANVHTLGSGANRPLGISATRSSSPKKWGEKNVRFPGQNGKSLAGTMVQVRSSTQLASYWRGCVVNLQ